LFVPLVALAVGVLLGGAGVAVFDEHTSPPPHVPFVRQTPAPTHARPLAALAGTWWQHSTELTISRSGVATLSLRLRRECGLDACDALVPRNIYYGGLATMIFHPMRHSSTTGKLAASTDTRATPLGATRVWFDPQRDLVYVAPFPGIKHPFCREHAYDRCSAW
jgi:hypothetical protein